jgi:muconolactone delta-isomerase
MEFLVEFDVHVPEGTPESERVERERAEASTAATLADEGHVLRIWTRPRVAGGSRAMGLYRAASESELERVLDRLPLRDWMEVEVTPLGPHPNDPAPEPVGAARPGEAGARPLPEPRLSLVYRLVATLAPPLDLGETARGRRRVVAMTGGTFTGPELSGRVLPGASADWQILLADGTALADLRYTLQTDRGDLLYVRSRGVRHGSAEVLARLGRGEDVDPSEYTFRTATEVETGVAELDWLNKGVFVSVGGRQPAGVTYDTYLVA